MEPTTLFSIVALIFSVVVHEVAHGYAALWLGDRTAEYAGRLTLNPFKHLTLFGSVIVPIITSLAGLGFGWAKPVPYNPYNLRHGKWGEALVAAAGPASNLLLATVMALAWRYYGLTGPDSVANSFFFIIVAVNCALVVLNLIPVPPLDGSKILFALIPGRMNNVRAWLEANQLYLVLAVFLFFWSLFEPVVRALISGILFLVTL